jgi:hypothetical protein
MAGYDSPQDRRLETEPLVERVIPETRHDELAVPRYTRCPVCGRAKWVHRGDAWELHQEELRRRERHARTMASRR